MMTKKNRKFLTDRDDCDNDDPQYRNVSFSTAAQDCLLWQKVVASVRPLAIRSQRIKGESHVIPAPVMVAQSFQSQEERRWQLEHFPKSVKRFSDKKCDENKELENFVEPSETKNALEKIPSLPHLKKLPQAASSYHLRPFLSRKAQRKIARQYFDHTARLDLHGLGQDQAYELLLSFIHLNAQRNQSLLLVITGKGRSMGSSGILRQLVPHWLATAPFRSFVRAVETASPHHGGEGAFYVRLRRLATL